MNLIGIEMAHGFGDAMFCMPLVEALCAKHNCKAVVAVEKRCADAFINVPYIQHIETIPHMGHGKDTIIKKYNIFEFYQITPHIHFYNFKTLDQNHSLAHTPLEIGRLHNVEIDPRPKIYLTTEEIVNAKEYINKRKRRSIVAIESEHFSGQSWANDSDFENIIRKNNEVVFLWLSLREPPFKFDNLLHTSKVLDRRSCIGLLKFVNLFISVGSGLFCASLSKLNVPLQSWILWTDELYRYKDVITQAKWIHNPTWVDNREQWNELVEKTTL